MTAEDPDKEELERLKGRRNLILRKAWYAVRTLLYTLGVALWAWTVYMWVRDLLG